MGNFTKSSRAFVLTMVSTSLVSGHANSQAVLESYTELALPDIFVSEPAVAFDIPNYSGSATDLASVRFTLNTVYGVQYAFGNLSKEKTSVGEYTSLFTHKITLDSLGVDEIVKTTTIFNGETPVLSVSNGFPFFEAPDGIVLNLQEQRQATAVLDDLDNLMQFSGGGTTTGYFALTGFTALTARGGQVITEATSSGETDSTLTIEYLGSTVCEGVLAGMVEVQNLLSDPATQATLGSLVAPTGVFDFFDIAESLSRTEAGGCE